VLVIDRQADCVIEAKQKGTTLAGVEEQSTRYAENLPNDLHPIQLPLPFVYESTSVETYFRDTRDVASRSRELFWFHKPDELRELLNREDTLRNQLKELPPLEKGGLRDAQFEAIQALEESLADGHQRSLIQMATGSGKTYMAVQECYRLIKYAKAKRILFLVDRKNLGKNADTEFQQFDTPAGRKFNEEYNVQRFQSGHIDPASKVCISTIQRMYSILQGEEIEEEEVEKSQFEEDEDGEPKTVEYNPDVPITEFDFIIIDECHRSIYNKWRQVLDYFDSNTPPGGEVASNMLGSGSTSLQGEAYFSIYYPRGQLVKQRIRVEDVYHIQTSGHADPINMASDVMNMRQHLKKLGFNLGYKAASMLYPNWVWVDRKYYGSGSDELKQAKRMIKGGHWDMAEETLLPLLESSDEKVRQRATFNLALVYEGQGNLDKALEMARQAAKKYDDKHAYDYINSLEARKAELRQIQWQERN
jgi:tetratricopeptide (TPR) repeat protein